MKKFLASPLFLILLTICFVCALFSFERAGETQKFIAISDRLLYHTYASDSLSTHFSFENPAQFGLPSYATADFDSALSEHLQADLPLIRSGGKGKTAVSLPCYNRSDYLAENTESEKAILALETLNQSRLSKEARDTCQILLPYLKERQKGNAFPYFEEPLSPTSGIHTSLPVLLAEFSMKNEADVKQYLSILSLLPAYFESLARYEADKAARGMFLSAEDTDLVISQCDFLCTDKGQELFTSCFQANLSKVFPPAQEETRKDYEYYLSDHARILTTLVVPAYAKLGDSLLLLREEGKPRNGLCQYENGRDYYEFRLQQLIGTNESCSEIEKRLTDRLPVLYEALEMTQTAYLLHKEEANTPAQMQNTSPSAENPQITSYLPALEASMHAQFPSFSNTSSITIKEIPPALLDYTAPAYYFTPCVELCEKGEVSSIQNIIYVNPAATASRTELFTTLAHEGYPGHMYQNIYFLSQNGVSRENILRYCLDFPGYSEGWALYVELMAYDYAASPIAADVLPSEKEQETNAEQDYLQLLKLSREIQLCVLCYLDIQLHDKGAQLSDITPYLALIGIKDPALVENVYSYLINEPGTYLKYYVGYLELLECKEMYAEGCKKKKVEYSDKKFHTFFLNHGPDSYTRIKECIQAQKSY